MKKLSLLVVVLGLATFAGCWKKKEEAKVEPVTTTETPAPAATAEQPVAPVTETAPAVPTAPATTPLSK